jgi:hypothetical protein
VVESKAYYVYLVVLPAVFDIDPSVVEEAVPLVVVDDVDNVEEVESAVNDAANENLKNIAVEDFVEVFVVMVYDDLVVALILDVYAEDVAVNEEATNLVAFDVAAVAAFVQHWEVSVDGVVQDGEEDLLPMVAVVDEDSRVQIELLNLDYLLFSSF